MGNIWKWLIEWKIRISKIPKSSKKLRMRKIYVVLSQDYIILF